jgi:UTP--glucose-1-phosphate uridylyltransferase
VIAVMEMPPDEISAYKRFVEKPLAQDAPSNLGSIGRYVLTSDVFDAIDRAKPGTGGEIQLTDAVNATAQARDAYAYIYRGPRRDAGRPLGFLQATVELGLRNHEVGEEFAEFLADVISPKK